MPQTKKKAAPARKKNMAAPTASTAPAKKPVRRGVGALICLILSVFSFIGLFGGDALFIGFIRTAARGITGSGYIVLPFLLLFCALILGFHRGKPVMLRIICALLLTLIVAALTHLFAVQYDYEFSHETVGRLWSDGQSGAHGGVAGGVLAIAFERLFTMVGAAIVYIIVGLFLLLGASGKTLSGIVDAIRSRPRREYEAPPPPPRRAEPIRNPEPARKPRRRGAVIIDPDDFDSPAESDPYAVHEPEHAPPVVAVPRPETDEPPFEPDIVAAPAKQQRKQPPKPPEYELPEIYDDADDREPPEGEYAYPPLSILTRGAVDIRAEGAEEVRLNIERLTQVFKDFGVKARVTDATRGPSVTRYEAELEPGEKLSNLTRLSDDIPLALGASGIRINPMPDKIYTVGIEVPNKIVSTVNLRDIIESQEFQGAQGKLTFAIGKNIPGDAIVGNISRLTHLLVAGTTGSGKSVCLNSLILSLLYKASPDEVRLIMIDPKMVEFRIYNGIPHLLVPVVTDVKKASGALQWAVIEMERRYRMFSERNARDLETYNRVITAEGEKYMPQIVIIIDELADLMMTSGKEVEDSIIRIAQKGRASGIHLVLATQSPRKEVITGIMKANIPSRIALKVSNALESRIIMDAMGAEKLVGNGDMLFLPVGTTKPMRVQGTYYADAERESVVEYVKRGGEAEYSDDVMDEIERAAYDSRGNGGAKEPDADTGPAAGERFDELLPQAAEVIFETKQASTSMLQRRLRLGYARAARIIDQLETVGMLGPFEGSKARQILMTPEQWKKTRYGGGSGGDEPPWGDDN